MFKKNSHTIILMLIVISSKVAFAQDLPEYDKKGELITDFDQVQRDRKAGILQRGGYNPEIAERIARERRQAAQHAGVPKLGNSSAQNPTTLSERNIYMCEQGNKKVYVDGDGRKKFDHCHLVRQGKSEAVDNPEVRIVPIPQEVLDAAQAAVEKESAKTESKPQPQVAKIAGNAVAIRTDSVVEIKDSMEQEAASQPATPCSGAILYKGNTYIFNESEPCPIPEEVFNNRRPIEAEPTYYTN